MDEQSAYGKGMPGFRLTVRENNTAIILVDFQFELRAY
jgi:hypothetical protein